MADEPVFPCPVPPKPTIARQHCRHYRYVSGLRGGGPSCAVGCDMSAAGAWVACMPSDFKNPSVCAKREDWTDEERARWLAWAEHNKARMIVCMTAIPRDSYDGDVQCPACGEGRLRWGLDRSTRRLHAACSTPNCFAVMQ